MSAPDPIVIRPCTAADEPVVEYSILTAATQSRWPIVRGAIQQDAALGLIAAAPDNTALAVAVLAWSWSSKLRHAQPWHTHLSNDHAKAFADGSHSCWLETLSVHPSHRRRRIATRLLTAAQTEARIRGYTTITTAINGENQPAIALFAEDGWSLTEQRPIVTGRDQVSVFLHRKISAPTPAHDLADLVKQSVATARKLAVQPQHKQPKQGLFGPVLSRDEFDQRLIELYQQSGRKLDDLPYTSEFDSLCNQLPPRQSNRDVFHRLHTLRKAGNLPRLGVGKSSPPKIEPADEHLLREMVMQEVETMGQRDRLPYTEAFDTLVETFNARTDQALSPHNVWRLIAKLAK